MKRPIKLPTTLEDANKLVIELIHIGGLLSQDAWRVCTCDHGCDGRALLRGPKCARCKAFDRWHELKLALVIEEKPAKPFDFQI